MACLVQTVTLSPAFMQEIKEDDQQLRLVLDRFREFVANEGLVESDRLRIKASVLEVRERIAFHFALEEAYGYFEDPVAIAPRLSNRVERLRAEHGELRTDLANIADSLEERDASSPAGELSNVQNMCREFLRRLDLHEANENALIVQAFNEDIGVGD